jgi:hypothetical protein
VPSFKITGGLTMDSDTCLHCLTLINCNNIPITIISNLLIEFVSVKTLMELQRSKLQDLGFDNVQIELQHRSKSLQIFWMNLA